MSRSATSTASCRRATSARCKNEILEWRLDKSAAINGARGRRDVARLTSRVRRGPRLHVAGGAAMFSPAASLFSLPRQQDGFRKLTANWHGTSTSGRCTRTSSPTVQGREPPVHVRRRLHPAARPETDCIKRAALRLPHEVCARQRLSPPQGETRAGARQKLRRSPLSAESAMLYETRQPRAKLSLYPTCGIGHRSHRRVLPPNRAITPTDDDRRRGVEFRQRIAPWASTHGSTRRSTSSRSPAPQALRRARHRHPRATCCTATWHLLPGLNTDSRHNAYVLRLGKRRACPACAAAAQANRSRRSPRDARGPDHANTSCRNSSSRPRGSPAPPSTPPDRP